jgi:hypothetical protein
VEGNDPPDHALPIHHGHGQKLVFVEDVGDRFDIVVRPDFQEMRVHEFPQFLLPAAEEELTERDDPGRPPVFSSHIDVGDRVQGMERVAERFDGVGDGLVPAQGEEIGGHNAPGRSRFVL